MHQFSSLFTYLLYVIKLTNILKEVIDDFSRKKRLIPLINLAKHYKTFEEFFHDYQLYNYHGIYWHLTDNPNFQIDPKYSPSDLSTLAIGGSKEPGLMVTTDLANWYSTFRELGNMLLKLTCLI